jgi:hypothetical protein
MNPETETTDVKTITIPFQLFNELMTVYCGCTCKYVEEKEAIKGSQNEKDDR